VQVAEAAINAAVLKLLSPRGGRSIVRCR